MDVEDREALVIAPYGVYDAREAAKRTCSVGELIDLLQCYDRDQPVLVTVDGDDNLFSTIACSFIRNCSLVIDPDTGEETWEEVW